MDHGTFNSNKIFLFNYLINRIQEKVSKITAKRKTDISDFKFECGKISGENSKLF